MISCCVNEHLRRRTMTQKAKLILGVIAHVVYAVFSLHMSTVRGPYLVKRVIVI